MDTATKVFNKFKDGSLPWLELDINFMEYLDAKEFDNVNGHYVEHREDETHNGWDICCLHGLVEDKTRVA